MFYRDNTTFGLSIEIANLSNLSGWPSQTNFTVTSKKFVVLGIQNPQVAFPKSKQFMGWPKYNGNTSITQDNSQSVLSVPTQLEVRHLTNSCKSMSKRANMISSRLQI